MVTIDLKPLNLTPDFVREFKALGKQVGYRNLGRAIAYTKPVATTSIYVSVPQNGNGHKRNQKTHHWACGQKRRKAGGVTSCACGFGLCWTPGAANAAEWLAQPRHFYPSYHLPMGQYDDAGYASRCKAVADALRGPECCGELMGVSQDFTNPGHWRYQCSEHFSHQRDAEFVIWA